MAGEKGRNLKKEVNIKKKKTQKTKKTTELHKSPLSQEPHGLTHSLVGPDGCVPRRETGIVMRPQAPPISRGPIIAANDKGKGIMVSDISGNKLRSELTSSVLGAKKGKSAVDENGANYSSKGFFTRLLTLDNDFMDIIDKDPGGGLWVEQEHLDAIEKAILEESKLSNQVANVVAANISSQPIRQDVLPFEPLKNQLALAPSGVHEGFNLPIARPSYTTPPHQVSYGPSSLINQSKGYKYQAAFGEPSPPCGQGPFDLAPMQAQLVLKQPNPAPAPAPMLDIRQYQGHVDSVYQHEPIYNQYQGAEQAQMGAGAGGFSLEQWFQHQQVTSLDHHKQHVVSINQQQQPTWPDFTLLKGPQPPPSL